MNCEEVAWCKNRAYHFDTVLGSLNVIMLAFLYAIISDMGIFSVKE